MTWMRDNNTHLNGAEEVTPPRCAACKHCKYAQPCSDQPYAEFWCDKGEWDGIASTDELYAETDCEMFAKITN